MYENFLIKNSHFVFHIGNVKTRERHIYKGILIATSIGLGVYKMKIYVGLMCNLMHKHSVIEEAIFKWTFHSELSHSAQTMNCLKTEHAFFGF